MEHKRSRAGWPLRRALLLLTFSASAAASLNLPSYAYPLRTLTTNVQPLNGTDNWGDEFPGAVVPFGMVQWSPDTTHRIDLGYSQPDGSGGYRGYVDDISLTVPIHK